MQKLVYIGEQRGLTLESIVGQMKPELEILFEKNIPHDKKVMKLLNNSEVVERRVYVHPQHLPAIVPSFEYSVEDYAQNEEERLVLLGSGEYCSKDLK